MTSAKEIREIYPEIEPYDVGKLRVSDIHEIYYELSGNKDGHPVLSIHGGPGGASNPTHRRFFDPAVYKIIIYDQRGCGKSTPQGELKENTTWELLDDIEKLRKHLGIEKWVVLGGSWGSTQSLLYAEKFPERVKALIVYGVFACRRKELMWLYQDGVGNIYPDVWEKYIEPIPEVERGDLLSAFHRRLTSDKEEVRIEATKAFQALEMGVVQLIPPVHDESDKEPEEECDLASQCSALMECHYFVNGVFLKWDNQVLDEAKKLQGIPGAIVQGRYDCVCPMETAWMLHKIWKTADFVIVPDAGHSRRDRSLSAALLEETDKFKNL